MIQSKGTVRHLMSDEAGRARCGQNLGHVDQGGTTGGDGPEVRWEIYHQAMSAAALLAHPRIPLEAVALGQPALLGAAEMCFECTRLAIAALQLQGRDDLVPTWAGDPTRLGEWLAGAWPDPWTEAEMADDFPLQAGRRSDR